jgi:hypothetical protein
MGREWRLSFPVLRSAFGCGDAAKCSGVPFDDARGRVYETLFLFRPTYLALKRRDILGRASGSLY